MKIVYTNHAKKKFKFLKELGWDFKPKDIKEVLEKPVANKKGYSGRFIAIGKLNETHELLVVYIESDGIITIISFYPVKKGRYD